MKIGLGTVQFGLRYGVANQFGQVSKSDAGSILSVARKHQVDTLDTAVSYGDSERILGELGVKDLRIITKLPSVPIDYPDVFEWVLSNVKLSLQKLKLTSLHALLLHDSSQLTGSRGESIYKALLELKRQKLINKIGVSIYDPMELDDVIKDFRVDLIQAPFNILDRRLWNSGWMHRLKRCGVEIHVRSAFLQGLLLMRFEDRPAFFSRWDHLWSSWSEWTRVSNVSPLRACIQFLMAYPQIDRIIVGVESASQLEEIVTASKLGALEGIPEFIFAEAETLLNPFRWS